jgi:SAM-dependent methyltransferase
VHLSQRIMSSIIHYSPSKKVSMADAWFDIATPEHFWVRRRFDVFRKIAGLEITSSAPVAEIGCGHGLVQMHFKESFGIDVDGFELNEYALSRSVATDQRRIVYDINERKVSLESKYGLAILFDVIEHIEDDLGFLEAALFHVRPGGFLAINVPALQSLYSNYDRAAGHVRRYSLPQLASRGKRLGLMPVASTYWGLPLLPLLVVRKQMLASVSGEQETIDKGFKPPSVFTNKLLRSLCALEVLPQCIAGTSAMCIFQKPKA